MTNVEQIFKRKFFNISLILTQTESDQHAQGSQYRPGNFKYFPETFKHFPNAHVSISSTELQ